MTEKETQLPDTVSGPSEIVRLEMNRMKRLREDVLLMLFYISRRSDGKPLSTIKTQGETRKTVAYSLVLIETIEAGKSIPLDTLSDTVAHLENAIDNLVDIAHAEAEKHAEDQTVFPVTPESLRASLPEEEIAIALGKDLPEDSRKTASFAKKFIIRIGIITIIFFGGAMAFHLIAMDLVKLPNLNKDFLIPVAAFLWACVGSLVWILVRFRTFGAAYAFDPAYAEIYWARVFSGSIITAILSHFIFGGDEPWASNWFANLPLTAFILGYAGKLQIKLLKLMVKQVEQSFKTLTPRVHDTSSPENRTGGAHAVEPNSGSRVITDLKTLKPVENSEKKPEKNRESV